jgi:hypothetical protein
MADIRLTLDDRRSPGSRTRLGREQVTVLWQVCPVVHRCRLCRVVCSSGSAQPLRGRGQRRAAPGRDRRGGYRQGKREEAGVASEKDPAEIIETIAQSIRVSQRGARRVRAYRFKELFGYQVLNSQRRERIGRLMGGGRSRCGRPSRTRDATTGWSCRCRWKFPCRRPVPTRRRQWSGSRTWPRCAQTPSGRSRCTSPLFRERLGYNEEQEAAGFGIRWARGSTPGHVEADLLYFAGDKHDVKAGEPVVLVECKRLIKDENELQAAGSWRVR